MRWIIVFLIICVGGVNVAQMQEAEEVVPVVTPNPYAMDLTFGDLGYQQISLKGMLGTASVSIPFDRSWYFENEVQLDLQYQVSPLVTDRSYLTVFVNQTPIHSVSLAGPSDYQNLSLNIPTNLLQGQSMTLSFQGYLRLTDEECEGSNQPGQWLNILPDSKLALSPSLNTQPPRLDDLPANVLATSPTREPVPLLLLLPGQSDTEMMTVAAKVIKGLAASYTPGQYNLRVAYGNDVNQELLGSLRESNIIMLGMPREQPLLNAFTLPKTDMLRDGVFYTDDNLPVPDDHAVVAIARSPWNPLRRVMVLSANNLLGLKKVGDIFSHQLTFDSLTGQYVFISRLMEQTDVAQPAAWQADTTTFRQLGQFDRRREGLGVFNEYYSFYRPAGWVFEPGSKLHLRVFTSPAIKFSEGSYIAVTMNDVALGSHAIVEGNEQMEIVFDLPPNVNVGVNGEIPQLMNLRVELSNQFLTEPCQDIDRAVGWISISADSYFTTVHTEKATPDLQVFPYPFVGADKPLTVVLPGSPSDYHLDAAYNLAMMLGMFSARDSQISFTTTEALTPEQRSGNMIVIGERGRQPLVDELLNNAVQLHGDELYRRLQNDPRGMLFTGVSPTNPESVYLLIFGLNREGLDAAVDALTLIPPPAVTSSSLLAAAEPDQPLWVVMGRPADMTTAEGAATNVSTSTTP